MNKSLTLDADVLQNLIYIAEDEGLMKKLSRYMRHLLKTKEDETLMSKEDFFARVDNALAQNTRGEGIAFSNRQEMNDWLNAL